MAKSYGPPSNFLQPANNFSELTRVVAGISIVEFAFPLQRECVDDDPYGLHPECTPCSPHSE